MPLRFIAKSDLCKTDRHVVSDAYETYRFLLADVASKPTRLICVFTPPFEGHDTGFVGDQ